MRIYVKRENWDGGLWMTLPATAADAQKLWRELEKIHPSVMLPFIGGVDSRTGGMGESLAGELVFGKGHLVMLNRLARRMDEMGEEELLLFTAALEMERPKSIEQVLETMEHLGSYELKPDIRDMEGLGRYAAEKEGEEIPEAIEGIFDYRLYGSSRQHRYGCFTEGGFVERRQPEEGQQPGSGGPIHRDGGSGPVFNVEVKRHPYGYESFSLPMTEQELAEAEAGAGMAGGGTEMRVLAVHDGLFESLPPGSTMGELNQAAVEIRALMDKGGPDWELLLAALEAERPETMEDACRIMRNCADYEFLPLESAEPEDFARYILERDGIRIPAALQPYIRYRQLGQRDMEEVRPVKTSYHTDYSSRRKVVLYYKEVPLFSSVIESVDEGRTSVVPPEFSVVDPHYTEDSFQYLMFEFVFKHWCFNNSPEAREMFLRVIPVYKNDEEHAEFREYVENNGIPPYMPGRKKEKMQGKALERIQQTEIGLYKRYGDPSTTEAVAQLLKDTPELVINFADPQSKCFQLITEDLKKGKMMVDWLEDWRNNRD